MKTKLITLAALLLSAFALKAQQGEIIYTEFDPPLRIVVNIEHNNPANVLELDFDGDGEADHRYYGDLEDGVHDWVLFEVSLNGWETRLVYLDENDPYTFDESDTLIPNAPLN